MPNPPAPLIRTAYRARERVKAIQARNSWKPTGDDGLPLPPPLMMIQVVGHADPERFQTAGKACADLVSGWVAEQGQPVEAMGAILDFGCGCGRVLRHWQHLPGQVVGSDYNPKLVGWVDQNLPFASSRVNQLRPPLSAADSEFDLVYAFSVFTHLDLSAQHAWIRELNRILKPGGLLLLTTKGDHHAVEQLGPDLARFKAGEPIVRSVRAEGTNHCAAYTPQSWVRSELLEEWEVLNHHPGLPQVMDRQEIWLARAP